MLLELKKRCLERQIAELHQKLIRVEDAQLQAKKSLKRVVEAGDSQDIKKAIIRLEFAEMELNEVKTDISDCGSEYLEVRKAISEGAKDESQRD
jgi:hypothetical protein